MFNRVNLLPNGTVVYKISNGKSRVKKYENAWNDDTRCVFIKEMAKTYIVGKCVSYVDNTILNLVV